MAGHKVLLGQSREAVAGRHLPIVYKGDAHAVTVAKSGSGKTRCVVIPNLICHPGSMCVTDTKFAELARASALWRSVVLGHEVRLKDPFRVLEKKWVPLDEKGQPCYAKTDPLDFIDDGRAPLSAAMKIAEAINPSDSLNEPHWSRGAQARFAAMMLFVKFDPRMEIVQRNVSAELNKDVPRNFATAWELLSNPRLTKKVLKVMRESDDIFIADQAAAVLSAGDDNREMKSIENHIRVACAAVFSEKAIMNTLTGTNVSFSEMATRPLTYVEIMPGDLAYTNNKAMKLSLIMMLSQIERAGLRPFNSHNPPILIELDEFGTLGAKFRVITDAMPRYRGFGVKFHTYITSLGDLKELYGENMGGILGNAGVTQFMGGTHCMATAEYFSKICGTETIVTETFNDPSRPGDFGGRSQSETSRLVYMPDEIMRVRFPNQIIKFASEQPMEERLIDPSLTDFPEYLAFQECIEQGFDHADARDFAARYRHTVVNGTEPSPRRVAAPAPPKRQHITFGRIFRELMGHDE